MNKNGLECAMWGGKGGMCMLPSPPKLAESARETGKTSIGAKGFPQFSPCRKLPNAVDTYRHAFFLSQPSNP